MEVNAAEIRQRLLSKSKLTLETHQVHSQSQPVTLVGFHYLLHAEHQNRSFLVHFSQLAIWNCSISDRGFLSLLSGICFKGNPPVQPQTKVLPNRCRCGATENQARPTQRLNPQGTFLFKKIHHRCLIELAK